MAQFDVHRNPGRTRASIPFVLVVQSDRWALRPARTVVPLVLAGEIAVRDRVLNPEFVVDGISVVINPLQITTLPTAVLGPAIANLDAEHVRIIGAINALILQGR